MDIKGQACLVGKPTGYLFDLNQTIQSMGSAKRFDEQISVIRILDSRREKFRLSKAYEQKIDVVNVITAPEIEMLIIHAEGAYDQFKR